MKPDSRRVYVFIVAGLIAAVVVGVAVWRMSSPSANYSNAADQSATTSVSPYSTSGAARSAADQVAMQNSMLIVLSDVWLDDASVMRKLGEMLRGYEQVGAQQVGSGRTAAPLASFFTFVLCGNFASASHAAWPFSPSASIRSRRRPFP